MPRAIQGLSVGHIQFIILQSIIFRIIQILSALKVNMYFLTNKILLEAKDEQEVVQRIFFNRKIEHV